MSTSPVKASPSSKQASSPAPKNRPTSTFVEPPTLKPLTTLSPNCIIGERAILIGKHRVSIAAGAVIHPFARIDSTYGPVNIGENSTVEERATVGGLPLGRSLPPNREGEFATTTLQEAVQIKSGANVEAGVSVGAHTEIDVGATIGAYAQVGAWCRVAPKCSLAQEETLSDFAVMINGSTSQCRRVDKQRKENGRYRDLTSSAHQKHVEALQKIIKKNNEKWL